jgi:hypothetical protein
MGSWISRQLKEQVIRLRDIVQFLKVYARNADRIMLKKIGVQVLYLHPYYSIVQSPVVPPSPFTAILSNTL